MFNYIPIPLNGSFIDTKWIFKNKVNDKRIVIRNKFRLVAKGFSQIILITHLESI